MAQLRSHQNQQSFVDPPHRSVPLPNALLLHGIALCLDESSLSPITHSIKAQDLLLHHGPVKNGLQI